MRFALTFIRRVVVAALVALMGLSFATSAAAIQQQATAVPTYTYETQHHASETAEPALERGPPTASGRLARDAVDRWSGGALARPGMDTSATAYTYNDHAPLAKVARSTGTTGEQAQVLVGPSVVFDAGGVAANTGRLRSRADELSGVLDPIARNSRTSAVLGTRQGRDVLAGGGRDLSPAQRALARDGDVIARGRGLHAEVTAVNGARTAGLTPQGIGVSRPICPACISFLEDAGATITSPFTA